MKANLILCFFYIFYYLHNMFLVSPPPPSLSFFLFLSCFCCGCEYKIGNELRHLPIQIRFLALTPPILLMLVLATFPLK